MATFNPAPALAILKGYEDRLDPADYAEICRRLATGRTIEDHREATKLAADTAKVLLTVDLAGLAAVGALFQFARNNGVPWGSPTIILFSLAVLLAFVAAGCGSMAITGIYKRADGRAHADKPAWSTDTVRAPLNLQALASLLALTATLVGLVLWAMAPAQPRLAVSSAGRGVTLMAGESMAITGQWTQLRIGSANGTRVVAAAAERPVNIFCR